MSAPYPWLERAWADFVRRLDADTLGHAYLLCGRAGVGKFAFAHGIASLILCEQRAGGAACGECRGCTLTASGNHPDLRVLQREEERSAIVIDQVRELIEFYSLKPHYRTHKVAIVDPAEAMNASAANALLKLLEEPPPGALLLLVSHRPGQLVATIRSRCQKLTLEAPPWPDRLAWLEQALSVAGNESDIAGQTLAGAPLELLDQLGAEQGPPFDRLIESLGAISTDPHSTLERAREHAGDDVRATLDALELLVRSMLLLRSGHPLPALHLPAQQSRRLQEIADKLNFNGLFLFLDRIGGERRVVLRSSGVRGAEVIENVFHSWARVTQAESQP